MEEIRDDSLKNLNQRKINERKKFGAHLDVITALIPL